MILKLGCGVSESFQPGVVLRFALILKLGCGVSVKRYYEQVLELCLDSKTGVRSIVVGVHLVVVQA